LQVLPLVPGVGIDCRRAALKKKDPPGFGGGEMPKIALIVAVLLSAAVLASSPVDAAAPSSDADTPAPSGPPKGYTCHDEAFTGSGPGFKSSQGESEGAAIKDWLGKATAIFADADWNTAKDPVMECVKQGLYSKCFATGVPCHPKPKE
jgi:hypothetical protein